MLAAFPARARAGADIPKKFPVYAFHHLSYMPDARCQLQHRPASRPRKIPVGQHHQVPTTQGALRGRTQIRHALAFFRKGWHSRRGRPRLRSHGHPRRPAVHTSVGTYELPQSSTPPSPASPPDDDAQPMPKSAKARWTKDIALQCIFLAHLPHIPPKSAPAITTASPLLCRYRLRGDRLVAAAFGSFHINGEFSCFSAFIANSRSAIARESAAPSSACLLHHASLRASRLRQPG